LLSSGIIGGFLGALIGGLAMMVIAGFLFRGADARIWAYFSVVTLLVLGIAQSGGNP
jgi:hypothetical protein